GGWLLAGCDETTGSARLSPAGDLAHGGASDGLRRRGANRARASDGGRRSAAGRRRRRGALGHFHPGPHAVHWGGLGEIREVLLDNVPTRPSLLEHGGPCAADGVWSAL